MLRQHEIEIRVRYNETDPMGFLHHGRYLTYFEIGRTELFRAAGGNYRKMEAQGQFVVVVKAECRYHKPARYDDVLRVRTTIKRAGGAKIEHEYHVYRDDDLLAVGRVTLAIIDRDGNVQPVPEEMQLEE
jgi:acyl-CoA thioester hydrolase